jgi:Acyl-protein synthetase, LuxE
MTVDNLSSEHGFTDFWTISPPEREPILLDAIARTHAWHYRRNAAYRRMAETRGVGEQLGRQDLARMLRPTAQTFKSYVGALGTAFPQDRPAAFLEWLADQLSVKLPRERFGQFRPKYPSLERLLQDFEAIYSDFGFEVTTSSGTSGRATIMVRDRQTVDLAVDCFVQTTLAIWGVGGAHNAIFMMPRQTRIAMARTARFGAERLGMQGEGRAHFTIPFPADPDRVRIRTGRTFRPGWRGMLEKHIWHPFARWMDGRRVQPRSVAQTLSLLEEAERNGAPTLLFGSLVQLHALSQELRQRGYGNGSGHGEKVGLPAGSLIGTGGGLKELYPFSPPEIRQDIQAVLGLEGGQPVPIRDVMGMAEANWAAPQCEVGNYHLPPWVYVVALNDDDEILSGADVVGLLAFLDPLGGGRLFPSFFKTTDQVRLVNGGSGYDAARCCPCGRDTPYIAEGTIRRVDLLDEAGCAGQL